MKSNKTEKKRILFALGNYYPTQSANGICIQKIIKELQQRGYEVECIVNDADHMGKSLTANGVKISFVRPPLAWSLPELADRQSNKMARAALLLIRRLYMYARLPLYLISFPSISNMYCNRIRNTIIERISSDRNNVVAVVGVNKPVEALEGAYRASKHQGIPLIVYFLDPLVGGYENHIVGNKRSFIKTFNLEKKILRDSRRAVFMDEHREKFIERYGDDYSNKTAFLGAPLLVNNISEPDMEDVSADKRRIIYAGAVYKDIRNPEYIMEVFRHVKKATLVMYVTNPEDWVLQMTNPNIEIRGRIPHETVIKEIKASDGVLNIGNSDPIFAPSKIIEYIGFGKPIITSYRIDEDSSLKYMKQYPKALCIDERKTEVREAAAQIDTFIEQQWESLSFDCLESIYHKNTPAAVADEIEKAMEE